MKHLLSALALLLLATSCGCHISMSGHSSIVLGHTAQREEKRALDLTVGELLILSSDYGSIQARASEGARPELHARIHAGGRTPEEAEQVLARYELRVERTDDGLRVALVGEPLQVGGTRLAAHVDLEAHLPMGTPVQAHSGSGDIAMLGELGALRLDTGYGKIEIDEGHGDVFARSGSGDVSATHLEGGEIELISGYGTIEVKSSRARRLRVKTGSGDVRIASANADELVIDTGYGTVRVEEVGGDVHARSGSGDVALHGVRGSVEASSNYGSLVIDGVISALQASTGSGDVHIEARPGSLLDSGWKVTSGYGQVSLAVPEGFACNLDAKTGYGSIECDFPVTIEAGKRKGDNRLKGTIGGGGGKLTLSSGSGDVALKKL